MEYAVLKTSRHAEIFLDVADAELLGKYSWSLSNGYASRRVTVAVGMSYMLYMHHEIMGHPSGDLMIDHINRNKLDNRRCNLRIVTRQQNALNCDRVAKGIGFDKTHHKWKAYYDHVVLGQKTKRTNIGTYATQEEALQARQAYIETLVSEHK